MASKRPAPKHTAASALSPESGFLEQEDTVPVCQGQKPDASDGDAAWRSCQQTPSRALPRGQAVHRAKVAGRTLPCNQMRRVQAQQPPLALGVKRAIGRHNGALLSCHPWWKQSLLGLSFSGPDPGQTLLVHFSVYFLKTRLGQVDAPLPDITVTSMTAPCLRSEPSHLCLP